MTSSKKSILNSNLTYVIAFVLPLIMMAALYYTREIFPWGKRLLSKIRHVSPVCPFLFGIVAQNKEW